MDLKFLLLLFLNVFLFFLIRFTKKTKWLSSFITVLFTTLVTLTVIEAAYRIFFKKAGISETGNFGSSFNTPVDLTGFTVKNIPDLQVTKKDAKGNVIYDMHYSIIPDSGFNQLPINHRKAYQLKDPTRDSVEFVFLGCSFTFGTGVADTATMAYRTGAAFNYNSVNLGGSGFGTHKAYQIFKNKFQNIPDRKKRVFVYTFIPDHLLRAKCIYTWCLNDPYFEVQTDSLHLLGPAFKHSAAAKSQVLIRLLSLNRALSLVSDLGNNIAQQKAASSVDDNDYKRVQLMLSEINNAIQARGDQLIILHWDDYKGLVNPKGGFYVDQARMSKLFDGLQGATTINVSSFFNYTDAINLIPQDNHPSAKGNALVSEKLVSTIKGFGIQ